MNQQEAFEVMKQGKYITHKDFTHDEYLYMDHSKIKAEDGVDFTSWLWENPIYIGDYWSVYEMKVGKPAQGKSYFTKHLMMAEEPAPIMLSHRAMGMMSMGSPDFIMDHSLIHDRGINIVQMGDLKTIHKTRNVGPSIVIDSIPKSFDWMSALNSYKRTKKEPPAPNRKKLEKTVKAKKRQSKTSRKNNR